MYFNSLHYKHSLWIMLSKSTKNHLKYSKKRSALDMSDSENFQDPYKAKEAAQKAWKKKRFLESSEEMERLEPKTTSDTNSSDLSQEKILESLVDLKQLLLINTREIEEQLMHLETRLELLESQAKKRNIELTTEPAIASRDGIYRVKYGRCNKEGEHFGHYFTSLVDENDKTKWGSFKYIPLKTTIKKDKMKNGTLYQVEVTEDGVHVAGTFQEL